jgi:malate dehydrogenase
MSRDDLLKINAGIVEGIAREVVRRSPEAILIVVSNPLDVMTYVAWAASGLPPERVVGQAGILDVARFRTFLAMELSVPVTDVEATLLGGHGDAMVPLPRLATVRGKPVTDLIAPARLTEIVERTRDGGAEIVRLLQTGSAYEAPGAATAAMVEAILRDRKMRLPCCAYCQGEYGVEGLFVGVPVILGRKGVEEIVELDLTEGEREEFRKSAASVRELIDMWKEWESARHGG